MKEIIIDADHMVRIEDASHDRKLVTWFEWTAGSWRYLDEDFWAPELVAEEFGV